MRVALVTEAGPRSPSTRYRALQYERRIARRLGEVDVLLPDDAVVRRPGTGGRLRFFARHTVHYVKRLRELERSLSTYDAVLVQRGAYPLGPSLVVRPLERFRGRVVVDIDDAVLAASPGLRAKGRAATWLYGPQQTLRLLRRADAVVVSSDELAASLPAGVEADVVLPSVPDPLCVPLAPVQQRAPILVGWVGTVGGLVYLDPIADVFRRLAAAGLLHLEVVCSRRWSGPAVFRHWDLAEEASVFARYAVGIMPLPDTPYTRAKAGFKVLQYMCAGIPVVASPVGVNRWLVETSGAGLLATTPAEWEAALRTLARDADLRRELGARGRAFVMQYADLDRHADALAGLLRG